MSANCSVVRTNRTEIEQSKLFKQPIQINMVSSWHVSQNGTAAFDDPSKGCFVVLKHASLAGNELSGVRQRVKLAAWARKLVRKGDLCFFLILFRSSRGGHLAV